MATGREHKDVGPGQAQNKRSSKYKTETKPENKKFLTRMNLKHKIVIKTKTTESTDSGP